MLNASDSDSLSWPQDAEVALGASVAALGLSNKAVYASDSTPRSDNAGGYTEGPDMAPNAAPGAVAGPPLEEHLAQSTLWPEVYKVYGHGNELYCLAADPRGKFLASACRAQVGGRAAWPVKADCTTAAEGKRACCCTRSARSCIAEEPPLVSTYLDVIGVTLYPCFAIGLLMCLWYNT